MPWFTICWFEGVFVNRVVILLDMPTEVAALLWWGWLLFMAEEKSVDWKRALLFLEVPPTAVL